LSVRVLLDIREARRGIVTDPERIRRLFSAEISSARLKSSGSASAGSDLSPPAPSIIAVCSGKGGVGKSTVALNLAATFAADGARVGLLDADVHSPDIPLMVGLHRNAPNTSWTLSRAGGIERTALEPIRRYGVRIMSSGFIVAEDQAMAWPAELVGVLLNQLIWSTRWGLLDYLVIDLPPGTSDIVSTTFRLLPSASAVIVVTPQDVAHLDNRRMLTALRADGVRVVGGIENMSGLRCPCCDTRLEVFPPVAPERSIFTDGLPRLGTVQMALVGAEGDDGEPVVVNAPDSDRGKALRAAAEAIRAIVG
jgi:ATP-binding protein involved in chromosome partitioning